MRDLNQLIIKFNHGQNFEDNDFYGDILAPCGTEVFTAHARHSPAEDYTSNCTTQP